MPFRPVKNQGLVLLFILVLLSVFTLAMLEHARRQQTEQRIGFHQDDLVRARQRAFLALEQAEQALRHRGGPLLRGMSQATTSQRAWQRWSQTDLNHDGKLERVNILDGGDDSQTISDSHGVIARYIVEELPPAPYGRPYRITARGFGDDPATRDTQQRYVYLPPGSTP